MHNTYSLCGRSGPKSGSWPGRTRASGNEDSGSDTDSDSEVEMTNAEDLNLQGAIFDENAFEMLLMGNQHPGVLRKRPFTISVAPTLLCAQFRE